MSNPESVFHEATAAVIRGDWQAAAALCDPISLTVFKQELLERFDVKQETLTTDRMLQWQPDLPREVAEYQVAQFNAMSDAKRVLDQEVPSVTSVDQLRRMSPAEVFAAWLEGQSFERQVERMRRETGVPEQVWEIVLNSRTGIELHVLGTIPDDDRIVHVVYRQEATSLDGPPDEPAQPPVGLDPEESYFADLSRPRPQLATLRRQSDGAWLMIANQSFAGVEREFAIGFDIS